MSSSTSTSTSSRTTTATKDEQEQLLPPPSPVLLRCDGLLGQAVSEDVVAVAVNRTDHVNHLVTHGAVRPPQGPAPQPSQFALVAGRSSDGTLDGVAGGGAKPPQRQTLSPLLMSFVSARHSDRHDRTGQDRRQDGLLRDTAAVASAAASRGIEGRGSVAGSLSRAKNERGEAAAAAARRRLLRLQQHRRRTSKASSVFLLLLLLLLKERKYVRATVRCSVVRSYNFALQPYTLPGTVLTKTPKTDRPTDRPTFRRNASTQKPRPASPVAKPRAPVRAGHQASSHRRASGVFLRRRGGTEEVLVPGSFPGDWARGKGVLCPSSSPCQSSNEGN
jgi:hypothetical protein